MIRSLVLAILVLFTINSCTNPSLKKTEEWIKYTVENHPADIDFRGGNSYIFEIHFKEGGIMEVREFYSNSEANTAFNTIYEVPINSMRKPILYNEEEDPVFVIILKPKQSVVSPNNSFVRKSCGDDWIVDKEASTEELALFLRKSMEDDLGERIVEAFIHLIELNGGEVVKDVF